MVTMRGVVAAIWSGKPKTALIELDLPSLTGEKPELRIVESVSKSHGISISEFSVDTPSGGMLSFITVAPVFGREAIRLHWQGALLGTEVKQLNGDILSGDRVVGSFWLKLGKWQSLI